jgi:hypothetical protein
VSARTHRESEPLRHDTLEAELAGVVKHDVTRFVDVLVEH